MTYIFIKMLTNAAR